MQYARDDGVVPMPVSGAGPGHVTEGGAPLTGAHALIMCVSFPYLESIINTFLVICS